MSEYDEREHRLPKYDWTTMCRYCGSVGFNWKVVNGGWRLVDHMGEIHYCQTKREGSFFEKG